MRTHPSTPRGPRALAALLALFLLAAGCGGGTGKVATSSAAGPKAIDAPESDFVDQQGKDEVAVTIKDNEFGPAYLIVTVGTKVTWTNTGYATHNVVPINAGSFDGTTSLSRNATHSFTFTKAGDYPYYCAFHGSPKMGQRGGIRVVAKK